MFTNRQKVSICALALVFSQTGQIALSLPNPVPNLNTIRHCQERAEQCGRADGQSDGAAFGRDWHYQQGFDYRYQTEYDGLFRRLVDEAVGNGLRAGQGEGEQSGQSKGQLDGERDGGAEGRLKGGRDGEAKADHQASIDVREPASREGAEKARQSDAAKSGEQKGVGEGDSAALKNAKEADYPKGTRSYAGELFAQPVAKTLKLTFDPSGNLPIKRGGQSMIAGMSRRSEGPCYHPNASYPTSQEVEAYRLAYNQAYRRAYDNACDSCRSEAYRRGENDAINRALSDVRNQDFGRYFLDGRDRGFRQGYDAVYGQIRQQAYQNAFNREYPVSADQAFRQTYEGFRQKHYASTRESVYQQTYRELFEAARQKFAAATLAQKYPIYSKQQYFQGRQEEKARFVERPLRFVSLQPYLLQKAEGATVTALPLNPGQAETYEVSAGQEIQLRFRTRNFGPECRPSVQLLIESGEGQVYLPENTFSANAGFPAAGLLSVEDGAPKFSLRQTAGGQSITMKVILRGANGESDQRTVNFNVQGPLAPASPPTP